VRTLPVFEAVKRHYDKNYYALLISVIILAFVAPLVDHTVWSHILIGMILMSVLLIATLAVRKEKDVDLMSINLATLSAVSWALAFCSNLEPFNSPAFQILALGVILFFFVRIAKIMLLDILTGAINSNRICGGACLYVLIGFCFALIHMMVQINDAHAYLDNIQVYDSAKEKHERYPLLIYFSFCTLSTVAYGDIVPISRLSRAISCLEALSGQLYLAIMVARLVGMHTAHKLDPRRLEAERLELEKIELEKTESEKIRAGKAT